MRLLIAGAALALVATSATAAQESAVAGARAGQSATSGGDAATFRADFDRVLDAYEGVFRKLGNARGLALLADARQAMRAAGDEQIARVYGRMRAPDLALAVQAAERLEAATPSRLSGGGGPGPSTPGFPNAPDILAACDDIEHDSAFTFGALVAFQVLRTVLAAAEFVCQEVIVILGEGGNTSLVCVPFAIAQDVAAIPHELADFCGGEEDSALLQGSYDRLDHIHTDLETARADIINNDNTNRDLVIANDNTNRDLIIANDNANRDLIMGELRNLTCDLMRLSATPLGQRESDNPSCAGQPQFPYNFPEHP